MILAVASFVINRSFSRGNCFSGGFLKVDTMKVQFSNDESAIMYSVPEKCKLGKVLTLISPKTWLSWTEPGHPARYDRIRLLSSLMMKHVIQ